MTATELFYRSHGHAPLIGSKPCGICGSPCDGSLLIGSVLSDTFTDWNHVRGDFLCRACLLTLRAGNREDQPRLYSWVFTESSANRYTKANLRELTMWCIFPPPPPYVIIIATSGQKHLIFKATVTHDSLVVGVDMEGERVEFAPDELSRRLELCGRIVAATGKPALSEFNPISMAIGLECYWKEWEQIFNTWEKVKDEPLSRLAAFLTLKKEDSANVYSSNKTIDAAAPGAFRRGIISPKAGGAGGPGIFG